MLTSYIQETIDNKWDNCWPVSDLRPLAVLDLISYLFFLKKLDDQELIRQKLKTTEADNFIYTREMKEFTWSNLKNLDAQQIHDLFKKQYGFIDLLNQYGHLDTLYSDFFKAPLLLDPTPKLLFNAIEIINIIEASDQNTQGAIVDYLFSKLEMTVQNGQEFIPQYISRLMILIAEPGLKEIILDPSAGNGSLLINAYKYVADNNSPSKNGTAEAKLSAMESDLMQLRLGAMNMMLHGIKDPNIRISPANDSTKSPTLILSNLVFPEVGNITAGNLEKEMDLLNQILETLQSGDRAVILVPQTLLKSDIPAIIKVRKNIIDHYKLEGVINLPPKSNSLFSGAGILIFNKNESTTTNVWFCKLEKVNKKSGETEESFNSSYENGSPELNDILNKWKNRKNKQTDNSGNYKSEKKYY